MGVEKDGSSGDVTGTQQPAALLEPLSEYCSVNKVQVVLEHALVPESSAASAVATAAAQMKGVGKEKGRSSNQQPSQLGDAETESNVVAQIRPRLIQSAPFASASSALAFSRGSAIESVSVSEVFGSSCFPMVPEVSDTHIKQKEGEEELTPSPPIIIAEFIGLSVTLHTVGGRYKASGSLPVSLAELSALYNSQKTTAAVNASPETEGKQQQQQPQKGGGINGQDNTASPEGVEVVVKSGSNAARAQLFYKIETDISSILLGQPLADVVQLDARLQSTIPGEGLNLGDGVLQQRVALSTSLALWKLVAQCQQVPLYQALSKQLISPLYAQQLEEFHRKNGTTPVAAAKPRSSQRNRSREKMTLPGICMALNDEWFITPDLADTFSRGGGSLDQLVEACSTFHRSLRLCLGVPRLFSGTTGMDIPRESEEGLVEPETVKEAIGMLLQSPQLGSISRRSSKHRHNNDKRYIVGDGSQLLLHEMIWSWGCVATIPPPKQSSGPAPAVATPHTAAISEDNGDSLLKPVTTAFCIDPKNKKGDVTAMALDLTDGRPVMLKAPFAEGPVPPDSSSTGSSSMSSGKAPPPLQSPSFKLFKETASKWKKDGGAKFTPLLAMLPARPDGVPVASSVSGFVHLAFSLACVEGGTMVKQLVMDLRPSEVVVRPQDNSCDPDSPDVALQVAVALANMPTFPSITPVSSTTKASKAHGLVASVVLGAPLGDQSQRYNSLLRLSEETKAAHRHYHTGSMMDQWE